MGGGLLYKLSQLINSYWGAPQRNTYQVENEINTGHEPYFKVGYYIKIHQVRKYKIKIKM